MCLEGMGSGILGIEMPLHQQQQQQQRHLPYPPNQHHHQQQLQQHHMLSFSPQNPQSAQQSIKHNHPSHPLIKPNQQQQAIQSDEDEPEDAKKRASPWQRMKWTDNMVRLLIMVVFYIEDDSLSLGDPVGIPNKTKKCGGGSVGSSSNGAVTLQKKGKKWKSVSRAMMEKGFYVSPQQCEDKFNDLNMRYKRVNEILGKGTSCRVVENQSLLETMDRLSPKMKDEVRKLLNSKHLFFREMCAYHNSGVVESTHHHNSENAKTRSHSEEVKLGKTEVEEEDDDDDDDDGDDDDSDEEDDEADDDDEEEEQESRVDVEDEKQRLVKKRRIVDNTVDSIPMKQLRSEMVGMIEDGNKSEWEKKEWLMKKLMKLEEEQVRYEGQALEMEKQRLKWLKFSNKKEREMERLKIKNERMKLESDKMSLLLRKKEIELLDLHHHRQQQLQQQQQQHSAN